MIGTHILGTCYIPGIHCICYRLHTPHTWATLHLHFASFPHGLHSIFLHTWTTIAHCYQVHMLHTCATLHIAFGYISSILTFSRGTRFGTTISILLLLILSVWHTNLFHSWLTGHTILPSHVPFSVPFCLVAQAVMQLVLLLLNPISFSLFIRCYQFVSTSICIPCFTCYSTAFCAMSFHFCWMGFILNQAGLLKYYFSYGEPLYW